MYCLSHSTFTSIFLLSNNNSTAIFVVSNVFNNSLNSSLFFATTHSTHISSSNSLTTVLSYDSQDETCHQIVLSISHGESKVFHLCTNRKSSSLFNNRAHTLLTVYFTSHVN
ncbi:MAG: hypothetical protein Q8S84_05435 [bacterium]|nr:hypothetical protein [bacterium]